MGCRLLLCFHTRGSDAWQKNINANCCPVVCAFLCVYVGLIVYALLSTSWFSWVWYLVSVTDVFVGRICEQQAILPFARWFPLGWIDFCVLDLELKFSTLCPESLYLAAPLIVYAWITYEFPRWPFYQFASAIGHLYLIHITFSFFSQGEENAITHIQWLVSLGWGGCLVVCFKWRDILVFKTVKYILK